MEHIVRQMKDMYEDCMNGAADPDGATRNRAIDKCIEIAALSRHEMEVLNSCLSAEIMKLQVYYRPSSEPINEQYINERLKTLCSLRDKLVDMEVLNNDSTMHRT